MLALDLSAERNHGDKIGSLYKTWFIPPKSGRYRFYIACDQQCRLWLATCPNTNTPKTEMLKINQWASVNTFFSSHAHEAYKKKSDWVNMTKGEPYYMEASYVEYNGGDHMNTAVEYE